MAMVPLDPAAARYVRSWLGPPEGPGLLALHHALAFRLPGLWGDAARAPKGVILVRQGAGGIEAFGAGEPESAVTWLINHRRGFALHAPEPWYDLVREKLGEVDVERVETWAGPGLSASRLPAAARPGSGRGAAARRLGPDDAEPFLAAVPAWALHGWRTFPALLEHAAAFGVPHAGGYAAVAWVLDQAEAFASVGAFTQPKFRRLGLGRAAAAALVSHLVRERGLAPLWTTRPENLPSRALARALGFSVEAEEAVIRWPARKDEE